MRETSDKDEKLFRGGEEEKRAVGSFDQTVCYPLIIEQY